MGLVICISSLTGVKVQFTTLISQSSVAITMASNLESISLQLENIRKQKAKLAKEFAENTIFLQNLENTLQSILDTGLPPNTTTSETLSMTHNAIIEHLENINARFSNHEGILINNWSDGDITLIGTDASRIEGSRGTAAIAAAFGKNSSLNISSPSVFSMSTEILEIQAIILGLKQAKANNIRNVHLTSDNIASMSFTKEAMILELDKSTFLQRKVSFNNFYFDSHAELQDLKKHFNFLSISHTKSHTNSTSILSSLNSLADSLAKSTAENFKNLLKRSDTEAAPLTRAGPPPSHRS